MDGRMDGMGARTLFPPPPNNVFVGGRHPPSPKDTEQNESIVWVARRGGHRGYPRSKGGAVAGLERNPNRPGCNGNRPGRTRTTPTHAHRGSRGPKVFLRLRGGQAAVGVSDGQKKFAATSPCVPDPLRRRWFFLMKLHSQKKKVCDPPVSVFSHTCYTLTHACRPPQTSPMVLGCSRPPG